MCVCVHGGCVSTSTWRGRGGGLVTKSCLTLATWWTVACQGPLSMGFSRPEYWSELPFPSPGDLPDPEIEPGSPALPADFLPTELQGKARTQLKFLEQMNGYHWLVNLVWVGRSPFPPSSVLMQQGGLSGPEKDLVFFFFLFSCPSRCQSIFLSPGILNILTQIIYNYNRRRISVCIHWWSRNLGL